MQLKVWKEHRLSALMLGTAQFGFRYGVANRTGQPGYHDVLAIVEAAIAGGVNCFDTAADYGASEEVLGRALRELGIGDSVIVVTKVRHLTGAELAQPDLARKAIEQSVAASRQRLQLECVPVVLFHQEPDAAYLDALADLKARGWLRHAGVSCGNQPGPAAKLAADERVEAMQLPGNLLDRRHATSGIFRQAAARGVGVFIRSVYLKGLLLMPEAGIPPELRGVVPVRRRIEQIAGQAGLTMAELAARYMLALPGVTCVLAGIETLEQMRANLAIFNRGPLDPATVAAVNAVPIDLAETLLTPFLWPSSKKEAADRLSAPASSAPAQ
ncbi:MAG: aldo/keto reductase [Lentisphaerae bacterium]|nr:aldo/keto reductase [Lentisphaerota bacterium]